MKTFFLALVFSAAAFAQGNPACQASVGPWTDTNATQVFYNGANTQCAYWILTYQVTGFSAVSIEVDSALGTSSGPGAFGLFSGTVVSGSNPSTSVSCATVTNCTIVLSGVVGWYRVSFTSHTGSGTIQGTLQGWKTYQALGGNNPPTGSGCVGTAASPCVVAGPDAQGAVPTKNPIQIAGNDGADVRLLFTDSSGRLQVIGPAAAGSPLIGNPILSGWSDGTDAQNAFFCPNQAAVTISAGTDTVLVAGVASKKTIICHLDFASSAPATFTIQQGTGSTCGSSTVAISGAYPGLSTFSANYGAVGALRTTVNANDVCLHSGTSVSVGGFVTYAQF